jgi:hypothetical protein
VDATSVFIRSAGRHGLSINRLSGRESTIPRALGVETLWAKVGQMPGEAYLKPGNFVTRFKMALWKVRARSVANQLASHWAKGVATLSQSWV